MFAAPPARDMAGRWSLRPPGTLVGMDLRDFIPAIIFGAVIGVLGRLFLPGRQRIGIVVTVLVGMGAAIAGTWVGDVLNVHSDYHFNLWGRTYDWVRVGIQVVISVVGIALAQSIARVFSADRD
jgi:uncharacterized membrane protein YeaQ/YmgE (transglycosylase-associated protein family)